MYRIWLSRLCIEFGCLDYVSNSVWFNIIILLNILKIAVAGDCVSVVVNGFHLRILYVLICCGTRYERAVKLFQML